MRTVKNQLANKPSGTTPRRSGRPTDVDRSPIGHGARNGRPHLRLERAGRHEQAEGIPRWVSKATATLAKLTDPQSGSAAQCPAAPGQPGAAAAPATATPAAARSTPPAAGPRAAAEPRWPRPPCSSTVPTRSPCTATEAPAADEPVVLEQLNQPAPAEGGLDGGWHWLPRLCCCLSAAAQVSRSVSSSR